MVRNYGTISLCSAGVYEFLLCDLHCHVDICQGIFTSDESMVLKQPDLHCGI